MVQTCIIVQKKYYGLYNISKKRSVSEFLFVGINHGKNLTQALLNEK